MVNYRHTFGLSLLLMLASCERSPLYTTPLTSGGDPVSNDEDGGIPPEVCSTCEDSCEAYLPIDSALHTEGDVVYLDTPPVGGPHHPCWADYRVYAETTPLPPRRWVHNLEHGAVVFLYNCPEGCEAEVEQLSSMVANHPRTLLTPYTDMSPGFAAVAWGVRLVSSCLDLRAFEMFYQLHFDHGRESVPNGAPSGC